MAKHISTTADYHTIKYLLIENPFLFKIKHKIISYKDYFHIPLSYKTFFLAYLSHYYIAFPVCLACSVNFPLIQLILKFCTLVLVPWFYLGPRWKEHAFFWWSNFQGTRWGTFLYMIGKFLQFFGEIFCLQTF